MIMADNKDIVTTVTLLPLRWSQFLHRGVHIIVTTVTTVTVAIVMINLQVATDGYKACVHGCLS